MPINLVGMASGLDTDSIISQLMAIEQNKVTAVQWRQISVTQHKTDLNTIKTKLDAVKAAAADLSAATTWKPVQTTGSADPTKVDVTLLGGAGIGGHTLEVDKLASSAQHGFSYTPSASAGQLTFFYGSDPNAADNSKLTIDVAANASAADVAAAINAKEGSPVYAAVVKQNGEDRLVFSARKTGASSDFTVDVSALDGGAALSEIATFQRTGSVLNAQYRLDGGTAVESESNVIEDAVPGVRLTLKGVTSSPVSVTTSEPAVDTAGIVKKVQALVDAYNAVVTSTRSELTEKKVPNASSTADLQKGQLFGDYQLTSMLGQLKTQMTQIVGGLGLSNFGVDLPKAGTLTQDGKDGKLQIDTAKLTDALNADYTKVRDLFSGTNGGKGLSTLITDFVSSQTGTNGVLTGRMASDDSTLKDFTDQITRLNDRMNAEQTRLKAQFAALETAMNNSQTQQAWLTSQIASLPTLG
ncbi:MAG TPA: flagellar filament capping protein FliD [Solirubrobacter sp.]|nr:flagellar filament capping protein FliD [Solirubrobacter sp.]